MDQQRASPLGASLQHSHLRENTRRIPHKHHLSKPPILPFSIRSLYPLCPLPVPLAPIYAPHYHQFLIFPSFQHTRHPNTAPQIQRALCALVQTAPDKLPDTISALYQTFWVEGKLVQKPEILMPVLSSVLGEDMAKEIMEKVCISSCFRPPTHIRPL